jgi:Rod binding domain-containing protein
MKIESNLPLAAGQTPKLKEADPTKMKDTAQQFEALLISQMMKSARESSAGGWGGDSGDKAGESMMDMAEQQLSQLLAAGGGLGLAKLVIQGISGKTDTHS